MISSCYSRIKRGDFLRVAVNVGGGLMTTSYRKDSTYIDHFEECPVVNMFAGQPIINRNHKGNERIPSQYVYAIIKKCTPASESLKLLR